jgi:hypothetical protein
MWSAQRILHGRSSQLSRPEPLLFLSCNSSFILTRAEWTPFQTHSYEENWVMLGMEPGTSGLADRNSDH